MNKDFALTGVLLALGYTSDPTGLLIDGRVISRNGRRLGFVSNSRVLQLIARGARKWRALKGMP